MNLVTHIEISVYTDGIREQGAVITAWCATSVQDIP
jgi:hypothetical protein